MDRPIVKEPKKPYTVPQLKTYGTVRELTRNRGPHGIPDHGIRVNGSHA
jgi:hypothetical protein